MSGGLMITVIPEELTFQFELDKQSYCDVKVVNNSDHHVAFKVKTTTPKKYCVRPNVGVVQPGGNCVITVTLQAQGEYPTDLPCKDKFLLQSTKVPRITDVNEISPETFTKDGDHKVFEELKLRVVFTTPLANHSNSEDSSLLDLQSCRRSFDTNTMLSSSMYDEVFFSFNAPNANRAENVLDVLNRSCSDPLMVIDIVHALRLAREERDAAIHQTKSLQQELEMLKRRRKRALEAGFSIQFAAFVGVIGILVGLIFNLSLTSPSTE